jgi:pimeloyl-ACP methyl ester carboxylesterase
VNVFKQIKFKRLVVSLSITIIVLIIAFLVLDQEKFALDDQVRSSLSGNFIKLADGVVHFEYSDAQNGPIVVLVPGFSTPSYIWDPTYDFLENSGYRVLRFDLYGRGFSDRPDTNYALDLYTRQIHALLSYLEIEHEPINLIGLSLGGPIVASYIIRYPDKIQTLTLIDPLTSQTTRQEIFPMNIPLIGEYITAVYLVGTEIP